MPDYDISFVPEDVIQLILYRFLSLTAKGFKLNPGSENTVLLYRFWVPFGRLLMAWNSELAPKMNTISSHQRVFTVSGQKTTNLSCFLMFFEIFSQKSVKSTIFKNLVKIQIFC